MKSSIQESVFRLSITRWATGLVFLCRAAIFMRRRRPYRAVRDFCWVARVSNIGLLTRIAERSLFRLIDDVRRSGRNTLIDSYLQDPASETCASLYSLTGEGRHDLFRDVMVLEGMATATKRASSCSSTPGRSRPSCRCSTRRR